MYCQDPSTKKVEIDPQAFKELAKDVAKEAAKDAIKEWLNEQFASFGKWTLTGLLSAALAGLVYLALAGHGLSK